jgi:hypothetical protein
MRLKRKDYFQGISRKFTHSSGKQISISNGVLSRTGKFLLLWDTGYHSNPFTAVRIRMPRFFYNSVQTLALTKKMQRNTAY